MFPILLFASLLAQAPSPIPPAQVFQEAHRAWAAEGGRTWGRSLEGPLLLVDLATRQVWASEADKEGLLKDQGGVFAGTLPKDLMVANTALNWAGKRWSVVVVPLPTDPQRRHVLLVHESWHRIQPDLGMDVEDMANGHLDKLDGRYWLELEWRALTKALESPRKSRKVWVATALACRTRRQNIYSQAAESERSLELAEGLAEYTGIRAAAARNLVLEGLQRTDGPFARSFAYTSGPAYGLLLDDVAPGWPRQVRRATDLSVLLQQAYHLPTASKEDSEGAASRLGGAELRIQEEAKDHVRQERLKEATTPLLSGPVLRVPGPFNAQFNPSNTEGLDDGSAYHPTATYTGAWGKLEVTGGSLRASDWGEARVVAPVDPKARPLSGPGWNLELATGWTIEATQTPGSWRLVRSKGID